jgi:hypothetical protein
MSRVQRARLSKIKALCALLSSVSNSFTAESPANKALSASFLNHTMNLGRANMERFTPL